MGGSQQGQFISIRSTKDVEMGSFRRLHFQIGEGETGTMIIIEPDLHLALQRICFWFQPTYPLFKR